MSIQELQELPRQRNPIRTSVQRPEARTSAYRQNQDRLEALQTFVQIHSDNDQKKRHCRDAAGLDRARQ